MSDLTGGTSATLALPRAPTTATLTGSDRLSSLAAFVSKKTHLLAHRSSLHASAFASSLDRKKHSSLIVQPVTPGDHSHFYHALTTEDYHYHHHNISVIFPEPCLSDQPSASSDSSLTFTTSPNEPSKLRLAVPDITSQRKPQKSISTESLLDSSATPQQQRSNLTDTSSGPRSKMHQTSSRLLRMTDDDRPFTRVCWFALVVRRCR